MKASSLDSTEILILLLKTVEEKYGESGVESLIKMVDTDDNTAMMIAVQSGSADVAKVKTCISTKYAVNLI